MPTERMAERIGQGQALVSDGAWGTFMQGLGLEAGECPELWCATRPGDVRGIAAAYVAAGAQIIGTNSFGGTRCKLDLYGLGDRTVELNTAAAMLSRDAAGDDCWVMASVGPSGKMLLMGDVSEKELYDAFAEQVTALARGGADAICVESMSAIDEASLAIRAAREQTSCEVAATFTFERAADGAYRTMMGVTPAQAAAATAQAGAAIVGANCGNGIAGMVAIVGEIRAVLPAIPILVQANAGLPRVVDGKTVFPEGAEETAAQVPALVAAGANIVGGCCGTTPEHIRAIRAAIAR